jgi:hypothetical protein
MDIVATVIAVTGAVERVFVIGLVGIGRPFLQVRNVSARLFFRLEASGDYRRLPWLGPLDGKRPISLADDAVRGFHGPSIAPLNGTHPGGIVARSERHDVGIRSAGSKQLEVARGGSARATAAGSLIGSPPD